MNSTEIAPRFRRRLLSCICEDFGLPTLRIASLGDCARLRALRGRDCARSDTKGAASGWNFVRHWSFRRGRVVLSCLGDYSRFIAPPKA